MRKFKLLTVQGEIGSDGKLSVPKGNKYQELSKMVELEIRKGARAGTKFIVTEVPKDTDRATVDQYIINNYRGTVTGTKRPAYVLTFQPAGSSPKESSLVCTLFEKKYLDGNQAYVGKKGNIRFYLTELNEDGSSKAAKKKA